MRDVDEWIPDDPDDHDDDTPPYWFPGQHLPGDARRIGLRDLFDETYRPIPGTNPQQFMAGFVGLTDALLPDIQEPVLAADRRIAFCAAVDRNGFLPTHNRKYSQPQTADPVWNAANCRNRTVRPLVARRQYVVSSGPRASHSVTSRSASPPISSVSSATPHRLMPPSASHNSEPSFTGRSSPGVPVRRRATRPRSFVVSTVAFMRKSHALSVRTLTSCRTSACRPSPGSDSTSAR